MSTTGSTELHDALIVFPNTFLIKIVAEHSIF